MQAIAATQRGRDGTTRCGASTCTSSPARASMKARPRRTKRPLSLTCAAPWLRTERCLVSYSDIFYSAATVRALACSARVSATDGAVTGLVGRDSIHWSRRRSAPDPLPGSR